MDISLDNTEEPSDYSCTSKTDPVHTHDHKEKLQCVNSQQQSLSEGATSIG